MRAILGNQIFGLWDVSYSSFALLTYLCCYLQRAFEGNNVLVLANRITKDPVPKIPVKYPK